MIDQVHEAHARSPELQTVENDGLDFAVWHWQGIGPRILLIHATGFHSRCWDQVVANLPGFDCWAFDMRGHGQSSKPAPPYIWKNFGRDVLVLAHKLNLQFATGVGHSMGGHSVSLAAGLDEMLFKSLILIDPIIVHRKHYSEALTKEHPVQRRKNHWQSPEEMFERYKDKTPFDTWNKAVLKDYCQYGLIPSKTRDGFELACPPIVEGSIYNNSMDKEGADIYDEIAKIKARTLVMHAPLSPSRKIEDLIPADLGALFPNGKDELLPDLTHFIPMEAPQLVADRIKAAQ
jgi:lipase